MVSYYTRYKSSKGIPVYLSFGFCSDVAVNAIVGKRILKEWKGCIDFVGNIFTSEELMLSFDIECKMAYTGIPSDIVFDSTSCVRPRQENTAGAHIVSIDRNDNSATTHQMQSENIITEDIINGCITRTVKQGKSP